MERASIILIFFTLFPTSITSTTVDTIKPDQTLKDGDTIVSARGEFELGIFSLGSSRNKYMGIRYKRISYGTIVWVANRESPLTCTSCVVRLTRNGTIELTGGTGRTMWSSNSSRSVMNPIAQLLDTGNLVVRDENDNDEERFLWQSFDYPGDTMLPGMKIGVDLAKGLDWSYTSWKSADDPSLGSFAYRFNTTGFPQLFKWKGAMLWSRTGPWVGDQPSGDEVGGQNSIYTSKFVLSENKIYYQYNLINESSSESIRFILSPNGDMEVRIWNDRRQNWSSYATLVVSDCNRYGFCGANSGCNLNKSPRCECFRGFTPKFPEKYESGDWSDGCVRKTPLGCGNGDGFAKYSELKLPDTRHAWYNLSMSLEECRQSCLRNCSCTAYANVDTRKGGSGCFLWFNELLDTTVLTANGQDMFVRMAASELGDTETRRRFKMGLLRIVIPVVVTVLLGLLVFVTIKTFLNKGGRCCLSLVKFFSYKNDEEDLDLPIFDFKQIANATNNFSENNRLGEGGFGPVYKGILEDGKEIAVKRLSGKSEQGVDEFKNEVSYAAELQHRNLVSLVGCCTENGERILIYEYMPNRSLDSYIFAEELRRLLDWPKRYNIINGIARGLLYLHQDSKLRIIHRDLKPSNILLDHDMNPKISDFGLARSFRGTQTEESTTRVVGTYGYMPPEYAVDGRFSVKSDVYSFGVLVIEIVSGKRNRNFSQPDHNLNLLGHAWRSYNEEKLLGLIDGEILESSNKNEVLRVIQIGLLCVQQCPEDRPSMSSVVLMLNSNIELTHPKQPGFFIERNLHEADYSLCDSLISSLNQLTMTVLSPRL